MHDEDWTGWEQWGRRGGESVKWGSVSGGQWCPQWSSSSILSWFISTLLTLQIPDPISPPTFPASKERFHVRGRGRIGSGDILLGHTGFFVVVVFCLFFGDKFIVVKYI